MIQYKHNNEKEVCKIKAKKFVKFAKINIINSILIIAFFIITGCRNKQVLIVTRGLPGSGKSTFAKEYVKNNPSFVIIEKDVLRQKLFHDKWQEKILSRDSESIVMSMLFAEIIKNTKNGKNIIVANTHLDDAHIEPFKEISKAFNIKLVIKDLRCTPLETCIDRDTEREVHSIIPIQGLYERYIEGRDLNCTNGI